MFVFLPFIGSSNQYIYIYMCICLCHTQISSTVRYRNKLTFLQIRLVNRFLPVVYVICFWKLIFFRYDLNWLWNIYNKIHILFKCVCINNEGQLTRDLVSLAKIPRFYGYILHPTTGRHDTYNKIKRVLALMKQIIIKRSLNDQW